VNNPIWNGYLARDGDKWTGKLIDSWGWETFLEGELETHEGKSRLKLTAHIQKPPEAMTRRG
jgi:hypothetical protein